jgi:hypothetical protein
MNTKNIQIGNQVVRSKGDYVVGRVGIVITIDNEKNRVQVEWDTITTWVSIDAVELTSIPYEIIPAFFNKKKYTYTNPKYKKL